MGEQVSVTIKLGQRVRVLRQERGLSQEQLTHLCDLDRTYISGIERGVRNVGVRNIEALAKALGVSISDLFEGI